MNKQTDTNTLLRNIDYLHKKFGGKLNTNEKWIIAYWQQCDRIKIEDGKIEVSDILNNATNPSYILDTINLHRVMRQVK
ncbi:hypothetical protein PQE71_gp093 [Bacillus phage Izhevsk]|uniref:Uncharacterized protein n=1 Tax=Bacillus phage Izhevsk TaxID=2724322 RepID=A0A6H0X639_9CAUD|nr:hypothetical protein PQE71_gp093 [Bacillus phage Izhevsk]QIW89775.1 hypothetical protein Izhevsk_94 [Bacillus phage Izhevsk]